MAKSRAKRTENPQQDAPVDFANIPQEQQVEIVCRSIEAVCNELESKGVDPYMLSSVLLDAFCSRMAEANDRESFESLIEEALEVPWEDVTIH